MGHHLTRGLLRQLLVDGPADAAPAEVEVEGHVEQGYARGVGAIREVMAQGTSDVFASLMSLFNPAIRGQERLAAFGRTARQIVYGSLTGKGQPSLGPSLMKEIERRPAEARRAAIRNARRYTLALRGRGLPRQGEPRGRL